MKVKYKVRIYIYLLLILLAYTFLFVWMGLNQNKRAKNNTIYSEQVVYTKIVKEYYEEFLAGKMKDDPDKFVPVFPKEMHISILNENGEIIYDNKLPQEEWPNFAANPVEVTRALLYGNGYAIHPSIYNSQQYAYYAIYEDSYVIRTGMPYLLLPELLFEFDHSFILFSVLLFFLLMIIISLVYFRSRKTLNQLKLFITSFKDNKMSANYEILRDEDLAEVQQMVHDVYFKLASEEKNTRVEREKLLQHFYYTEEGISFFTREYENIYTNVHYIQYLNLLLEEPTFDVKNTFTSPVFNDVVRFLENPSGKKNFTGKLFGNGRSFGIRVVVFDDKSFEIVIRKLSETEVSEMDAAAMTNSIAHELKTPVTGMRGYLETLQANTNINPEKQIYFLEKAYKQCLRLDEIIQDMVLLSKTIYSPQYFLKEDVNLYYLLEEMIREDKDKFDQHYFQVQLVMDKNVTVKGNSTLLASIFRNLETNAIKYAGENITITINNYMEDSNYYYFSFSDNGVGVDEKHLSNIFNRFYRVSDGRTRNKGGSGLGLAIVKDAVHFHHGEILAKNRTGGGLEFLFTLRKTDVV